MQADLALLAGLAAVSGGRSGSAGAAHERPASGEPVGHQKDGFSDPGRHSESLRREVTS